jgi:hypothetical protein
VDLANIGLIELGIRDIEVNYGEMDDNYDEESE